MKLNKDLKYWKKKTPSGSVIAVLLNPNFYALKIYRLSHFLSMYKLGFLSKILWGISRVLFSVDIDWRAEIGKNFMIIHGIGIVIGKNVSIGDNVTIYQGVTLGGNGKTAIKKGKLLKQPMLEDNIILYTNSVVIGPILIESNSIIGACALVVKDVPKDMLVTNQSKMIMEKNR